MVTLDFILLKKAAIAAFLDLNFDTSKLFTVQMCFPVLKPFPPKKRLGDNTPRLKVKMLAGIVVNDDVTST